MNNCLVKAHWLAIICFGILLLSSIQTAFAYIDVQSVESETGISAWLVEDSRLPIATINVSWRGGSAVDPEGLEGLTNLMASLIDEGADDLDSLAFKNEMARLGATMLFDVSRDQISANIQLLTINRADTISLVAKAINTPRFDEDAVARIKGEITAYLKFQKQDPATMAKNAWYQRAFMGHGYAHPTSGTETGLSHIKKDDIIQHHNLLMARDNLIVSIVGDMDADTAKSVLDELFGDLPAQAQIRIEPSPGLQESGSATIQREGPQTQVFLGLPGIAINDPDLYAAYVMNHILGGAGLTSRLMTEVREKKGLTYSISSNLYDLASQPVWILTFASDNDTVDQALTTVEQELRRISQEPVSEEELHKAKTYLTGSYALRFDSGSSIALSLTGVQLNGWPKGHFKARNDKIEAVTRDDILRVAQRLLQNKKPLIQFVGNSRPN